MRRSFPTKKGACISGLLFLFIRLDGVLYKAKDRHARAVNRYIVEF